MTTQRTIVEDRYTFSGLLGLGGAAEVYLARDNILRREVAIKVLKKEYARDEEFVRRFRQEAWSTASLSHPHIVQVYDLGRSEDGAYYTAMEYVEGGTLKERLLEKGALLPREAATIALQIADALHAARERAIIHRDIKPQNILLTRTGDIKVTDFGIARSASSDTTFGTVLGTASYMSPEQGAGGELGPRSDLYSLGVVFYEMLTGTQPYDADTPVAVVMKHVNEPLRPPRDSDPSIPEEVNAVVVKLLAKRPEDRHENAAELIEDLKRVGADATLLAADEATLIHRQPQDAERARGDDKRPEPAAKHTERVQKPHQKSRRRWLALLALSVSTLLLVALVWSLYSSSRTLEMAGTVGQGANPPAAEADFSQSTGPAVTFVHRATPESTSGNSTYLDDPLANGDPDAFLQVTQNWSPGEDGGVYNDHPVGVWYDRDEEKWAVFNQDRAEMPQDAAFNVAVWTEQ